MSTNKEKLSAQALRYIEKGQYERAIREYLKIVAEDEKDVRTWLKIGDLFAKLGQKAEAAQTYQKVARFYSEQGFYLKAVAVYKQILKMDPRLTDVNVALAGLYRQLGMTQDAITQYEAVAAFLQREGRSREAIAAHQAILELEPENVAQRIKLAELYSKEEMWTEAAEAFAQAAEQLKALGRLDDFLKVSERLLFHDPDNHAVARDLASHYLTRGDPRRALQRLQPAFKADPTDVSTLELLASAFLALNQSQKCVSVLRELGRLHTERGERDAAIAAYQRILDIAPEDKDARAALHESLSRALPRGGERAPLSTSASASAITRPGLPHSARSPRPVEPQDEEVIRTITEADVYAKYGLYGRAVDHLQRALERQPYLRAIRERLASFYEMMGQVDAAIAQQWALFSQAKTSEESAGCLSEILRLDPQNRTAVRKWQEMSGRRDPGASGAAPVERTLELTLDEDESTLTEVEPGPAQDELDEVMFFLQQGMHKEARLLLEGLLVRHPADPQVLALLAEAAAQEQAEGALGLDEAAPSLGGLGDGAMDDGDGLHAVGGEVAGQGYEMTRQGLRERGGHREDGAAAFELGAAYRDMGLFDDAIAELRKALQRRYAEVRCRALIGSCLLQQGRPEEAIIELKRALHGGGASESDLLDVYYQLGRAYEAIADSKEARAFYEKAQRQDPGFRDIKERLAALR